MKIITRYFMYSPSQVMLTITTLASQARTIDCNTMFCNSVAFSPEWKKYPGEIFHFCSIEWIMSVKAIVASLSLSAPSPKLTHPVTLFPHFSSFFMICISSMHKFAASGLPLHFLLIKCKTLQHVQEMHQ